MNHVEPFTFDWSELPLAIITAQGDLKAEHLEAHFAEYRQLLARDQPYVLVFDGTQISSADASVRKQYADFMTSEAQALTRLCLACGFVIRSPMIRGALTAVLWVSGGLPFEHRIFATRADASAWALSRFAEKARSE